MTPDRSRWIAVGTYTFALTGVYAGGRLLARIDDLFGPDTHPKTSLAGDNWSRLLSITYDNWIVVFIALGCALVANAVAADALLDPHATRPRSIGVIAAAVSAHVAVSLAAGVSVQPAVLLQLVATLLCVQVELTLRRSAMSPTLFAFAVAPVMLLDTYGGVYLDRVGIAPSAVVPLAAVLFVYWFARSASGLLAQHRRVAIFFVALALAVAAFILSGSLSEYAQEGQLTAYAPQGQPWRSIYFAVILASYAIVALPRQHSPDVNSELRLPAMFRLAAIMTVLIPTLIVFTPHGIVLASASAAWLLIALFARRRALAQTSRPSLGAGVGSALLLVALFGLLIADRLVYVPTIGSISPLTITLAAIASVLIGILNVVATVVAVWQNSHGLSWRSVGVRVRDLFTHAESLVLISSIILFAVCAALYSTSIYLQQDPLHGFVDLLKPSLGGFVGVYATSWAALAFTLNIVVVGGYFGVKALGRVTQLQNSGNAA